MRYWDSSALVPLILHQGRSRDMERLLGEDSELVTWWGTSVECYSALMRLVREGTLPRTALTAAENRLHMLRQAWDEILPDDACRRSAERMLRVHALRAGDALQLAAALAASDHEPEHLAMVCLDARLADAARMEGFTVLS